MDEWRLDVVDLDAYLVRIDHGSGLAPDGETLARLHRAHVRKIPFENLDIPLGRGISVELTDIQRKLVARRRGGYCYEHNLLFAAMLERLGYSVERFLARVGDVDERPRPRSHLTLRVSAKDGIWLADVGFGAGLLDPLEWDDTATVHHQGDWAFQLTSSSSGAWQVRETNAGIASVLYSFTTEAQHAVDVEVANHFTSTHPSSPFVGQLIVMRKEQDTHHLLRGRQRSTRRPDGTTKDRVLSDVEVADVLRGEFGLSSLSDDEIGDLVSSLPAADNPPPDTT